MEPVGFRLLPLGVIFNPSHVNGWAGGGSGRKVGLCRGAGVTGDHGVKTRFARVRGRNGLEPSSRGPPWGVRPRSTRLLFRCAQGHGALVEDLPGSSKGHGQVSWLCRSVTDLHDAGGEDSPILWFVEVGRSLPLTVEGEAADANIVRLRNPWANAQGHLYKSGLWLVFDGGDRGIAPLFPQIIIGHISFSEEGGVYGINRYYAPVVYYSGVAVKATRKFPKWGGAELSVGCSAYRHAAV